MDEAKRILAKLSVAERTSLRGLMPTMMKKQPPKHHMDRFIAFKLAEQKLGGPVLTPRGEMVAKLAL